MACFSGEIYSKSLQMATSLQIILPGDYREYDGEQYPDGYRTLYLLHGHTESAASWNRWTSVERYARAAGIAVIMPEVQRSFYRDMAMGLPYFTYLTEELPLLCKNMFGISCKRKDTFIAGSSMGGYGALRAALTRPEQYSGCAAFSGCFDLASTLERLPELKNEWLAIFGSGFEKLQQDYLPLLAEESAGRPEARSLEIFMSCGLQDMTFLPQSRAVSDVLKRLGYRIAYHEGDGRHDWEYWDRVLAQYLNINFNKTSENSPPL